ncbi:MAG: apolipoprotein N-acyltransferase [Planctomycetales bacterium]|nr:apolipoprotein N-acyltransferase [Planctomycetales bacterium]
MAEFPRRAYPVRMPTDETATADSPSHVASRWRRFGRSPFTIMAAGSLLLWLAQPGSDYTLGLPRGSLGWLGWIALAPWVWLILAHEGLNRRGWTQVWLGGSLYWLIALHWIRLPHPLTPIGWPLLAGYLGVYPLLFVMIARRALRNGAPLWIAAPVIWIGCEWVQAHLFTGFALGLPSLTQAPYPVVIQISDLLGAYGVSFLLVMTATAAVFALRRECRIRRTAAVLITLSLVAASLLYGHSRLADQPAAQPGPTIAIVQSDALATWDPDPNRSQQIMDSLLALTRRAASEAEQKGQQVDLYLWPESMCRVPLVTLDNQLRPPADMPGGYASAVKSYQDWLGGMTRELGAPLLLGVDRYDVRRDSGQEDAEPTIYNAAALTDAERGVAAFYDKTHRVPFGEYIPLAKNMPALYYLTPMPGGLGEGAGPVAMTVDTEAGPLRFAPSICYESVVPHVIRRHVHQLIDQGEAPDVLVNVTNDAWFWGASELDMHLACGVFRAVENRRPLVIAANTGLSAVVDGSGRLLCVSNRMSEDILITQAPLDSRDSFYTSHGDWFALGCLVVSIGLIFVRLPQAACHR